MRRSLLLIPEYKMLLKLYWEAHATYPRIQYAIEAVLGSTVDGPCHLYPGKQYANLQVRPLTRSFI